MSLKLALKIANDCGIEDESEVMQALRFLHELGSIQFFEKSGLNKRVVINPQWIIDVMACIISLKKNAIKV